jgi:oligopeptide/dipeptide ABC transporter ATP-binding protein
MSALTTMAPSGTPQQSATNPEGGGLEVDELHTTFVRGAHQVHAVRGVSFGIEAGRTMVLLGESGSGKSVTARSILRLHGPNARVEGSVRLAGIDLSTLDDTALRDLRGSRMALIPQDPTGALDPLRRCGAQIVEVLRLHRVVPAKREAWIRAEELLRQVGIPDPRRVARSYPHQLSGGMRQRVMIAIAISCNPTLLIADEPTTALDVTVQAQILELIAGLQRELGMATLLVTHDIGVAEQVADTIGVMYAGRLVEHGPAEAVLRRPRHPYTQALIDALPDPDTARGTLRAIPGQPPVAGVHPSGCAFWPRCPDAQPSCRVDEPVLLQVPDRLVACPVRNPQAVAQSEPSPGPADGDGVQPTQQDGSPEVAS